MSAVMGSSTYEMDASYAADFGRDREPMKKRSRHPECRRKGSAPTRVSGMHCRRNKRWTWGSGRGPRMANLRAFAGCMAVAIATLASNAFAITIQTGPVGNAGNTAVAGNGFGAVPYVFQMGLTEVTNAQYTAFLNSVDLTSGTSTITSLGLYNSNMSNDATNGGILFNGAAAAGSRYTVRNVANPSTSFANRPVNFVTWFSAARFVNWLNSGTNGSAASINTGVYALGTQTSGTIPLRNTAAVAGLTERQAFVIPSANEWTKAAFYNANNTDYFYWPTKAGSSSTPTVATTANQGTWSSNANIANYGGASGLNSTSNVGSFTATSSTYGMFDMLGNVTEFSDTLNASNPGLIQLFGGSFNMSLATAQSTASSFGFQARDPAGNPVAGLGFRVAQVTVAPVPEPETITLAGFGIVGLCGANWMRRRRRGTTPALPEAELLTA